MDISISKKFNSTDYINNAGDIFKELIEKIDAVFWIYSGKKLQYISLAYEKLFGKKASHLYKNFISFFDSVHPEDLPKLRGAIKNHNFIRDGIFIKEFRIVRPNKDIVWISARAFPVNNCGDTLEVAGILEDITCRKVSEEQFQKSLQNANELNELKSQFVSMISHEFRSPLTTIQSSVEILELYGDKLISGDRGEHFKKIYSSINYLADLLDDVITLSRAEARKINPNFEKLEIVDYSSRIIEQLKSNFQNAVSVNFNPAIPELDVLIDKKLYTQILSNLLSNAIKYTPEGKKVEINISQLKEKFILEVCDNGIGIPKEAQDKIFTPFIRASNAGNIAGTGLGLAIVQQSVNILNGKISFKSEVNKGSIFKVILPINNHSK